MSSEAAGIARMAAAEIQRRGLHKGSYMGAGALETCPLCLTGALNYAAVRLADDEQWAGTSFGADIVQAVMAKTGGLPPAQWNDREETTAADVIALLNAVADDLDAQ